MISRHVAQRTTTLLLIALTLATTAAGCSAGGLGAPRARATAANEVTATFAPTAVPSATATASPSPTSTPPPEPRVVGSYPINGDMSVLPARALIVDFDRPMNQEAVAKHLTISPTVEGHITWPTEQRLVFTPAHPWSASYEVTLTPGALDMDGWPTREAFTVRFACGGPGVPVPIFMYHHVAVLGEDASKATRDMTVSPDAFAAQMVYLSAHGWQSINPTQLAGYLGQGQPLPPRPVIITLDDGYEDVYTAAYPIFVRTGLKPVLFIVPKYVGGGDFMSWEQLQELVSAGFAVGAHGYDHASLRKASAATLRHQVDDAQAVLTKHLGVPIDAFCYPYGSYNPRALEALATYHYTTGFTSDEGIYQSPAAPYELSRVWVGYDASLTDFVQFLPQ